MSYMWFSILLERMIKIAPESFENLQGAYQTNSEESALTSTHTAYLLMVTIMILLQNIMGISSYISGNKKKSISALQTKHFLRRKKW